jgi:hypothetical protein
MRKLRGETNPYTILLLLGLAVAGYFGFYYIPFWLDHLEVREAVDQAYNVAILEGEESAKSRLLMRLNSGTGGNPPVGEHFEVNEDGVEEIKKGLGLTEEQIVITNNPPNLSIRIDYARTFVMKPSEKRRVVRFSFEKKGVVKR